MTTFLIILIGFLVIGSIGGLLIYLRARKLLREQKNYERGLKIVPLLIHLPPLSEDTDTNGRDARDLIDENVSKAQILYNIIASTTTKGFKSRLYGQRHFGFEIVASGGFVYFYVAVPMSLLDIVQQAIVSAYPSARMEEVAEHNIFSPVGKISGTVGGELILKEPYAYPIATFQDLKRDAMQSLLNSLSLLGKEDGAGIQILMRPAQPSWRKNAQSVASSKRKGEESSSAGKAILNILRDLVTAFNKAPEGKEGDKKEKKELSSTEQAVVEAIEEKTRHPGYEVLIRVIASSDNMARSQTALNNIVATFSLFESQGRNGFKYVPAKDIESFVTAYILRFFPQENNENILNAVELATLFHFPDQKNIPTSQLERQASKQVDGPRNLSEDGLLLGYNLFRGTKKKITLSPNDRRRHMYVVGQTGTGKSTFLENLALQDMINGDGFAFIDPHGDTAEKLLSMVPKERTEDVIYFSPADMEYPLGLNLFEFDNPEQKDFLIQEAINMLYKLYDPQHQGIIGPRYEHWFRNAALTLMSDPGGSTFIDIPKVFTDNKYAKQKLAHVTDQTVLDFWNKEMAQTSDYHKSEVLGWFVSKFGAFLSNEMMRNIIGQTKSSFNLREIMDNKKILLVNLSKGRAGELNSKLLGMIFVMKFQAAAMSRANVPEDQRPDFSLYVDEFQNFSTDSFATILSEARKYHLSLMVANQFTTQLTDEIRDAVFGNVGSIISFRVGTNDAEFLSKQFAPVFDNDDLQRIPNANTVVRLLVGGIPSQSFSMATLPPLGSPNQELGDALKQLSAAKYGRPKAQVEKVIFERLRTIEDTKPALTATARPGVPKGSLPPKTSGSSFLDEWLSKRNQPAPTNLGSRPLSPTAPPSPMGQASQSAPFGQPKQPVMQPAASFAPVSSPATVASTTAPMMPPNSVPLPPRPQAAGPATVPNTPPPAAVQSSALMQASAATQTMASMPKPQQRPAPAPVATPAPEPSAPIPEEPQAKTEADVTPIPTANTEGTMHVRSAQSNQPTHQQHAPDEDTIYIDQDGNLHTEAE